MLLAIDIGNTNLTFGVFEEEELRFTFRLTTNLPRTSNEFGEAIVEALARHEIQEFQIQDVIIASVVPKVMYSRLAENQNKSPDWSDREPALHCIEEFWSAPEDKSVFRVGPYRP